MNINRYNRGFFKFGPLEQCKDGELVFFKDISDFQHRNLTAVLELLTTEEHKRLEAEQSLLRSRALNIGLAVALVVLMSILLWVPK